MALDWDFIGYEPLNRKPLDRLHDYWESLADGGVPKKSSFRPTNVPELLPFLSIIEATDDGDLIYRLFGSGLRGRVGFDLTGVSVMTAFPDPAKKFFERAFNLMLEKGKPACHRMDIHTEDGGVFAEDLIYMPLADEEGKHRFALGLYWMESEQEYLRIDRKVSGYFVYPLRFWIDDGGMPLVMDIPSYDVGDAIYKK
ncbi:PAS domain-containing protein [Gimibacter soli]|uniref:PAS domain-containing protein n=1 Tax=Gimibacter soli TaxID=3024400 RepID=A0AAF0BJW2_9PROT|nr:PAS domain-containing protein [Gimibacter soli]WCL53579.1 PAS domain-containing protein [Gimibacter soli]